jgi:DNA segregation ATPase FtsK/SpoIIIE-like protein
MIVAGASGSGKSVTLNYIISWIIEHHFYGQVTLLLFDLKRGVEFAPYANSKHLLRPIVETPEDAVDKLLFLLDLIEQRYTELKQEGYRSVYETGGAYPSIVLVIDEYAELVAQNRSIASLIVRIAAIGRAAGVHIILATQRPSVKVISGDIKANFPVRIGFRVPTATDSRVVIDRNGCELLTGYGDGFMVSPHYNTPLRFQAAMITAEAIRELCLKDKITGLRGKALEQQYEKDIAEFYGIEYTPATISNESLSTENTFLTTAAKVTIWILSNLWKILVFVLKITWQVMLWALEFIIAVTIGAIAGIAVGFVDALFDSKPTRRRRRRRRW